MDNRLFDSLNFFVRLTGVADKFISDVRATAAKCLADPEACDKGSAAIYGMAQAIPDRSIVDQITWYLFINILILIHPSILFFHLFFLFYQTFFTFSLSFIPPSLSLSFFHFLFLCPFVPHPHPFSFFFLSLSLSLLVTVCASLFLPVSLFYMSPCIFYYLCLFILFPKSFRIFIRILLSSTCTRTP
jgi:hypothetical protein